jgi:hypothetical protein
MFHQESVKRIDTGRPYVYDGTFCIDFFNARLMWDGPDAVTRANRKDDFGNFLVDEST